MPLEWNESGAFPKTHWTVIASLTGSDRDRALSRLERNSLSQRVTDGDFEAVRDALRDRGDPSSIHERYLNVLDGMRQRVVEGKLSREEFAALRAELTQKAREASGEKKN